MAEPTRSAQIVEYLPTLYYRDPLVRRVIDAVAGRLAAGQLDAQEVMNAHWVDTADNVLLDAAARLVDLPRIGALAPLIPFPDEETARQVPVTVLVDPATVLTGPGGVALTLAQLAPGQRLFAGGVRQPDGAVLAARISVGQPLPTDSFEMVLNGRLARITPTTPNGPPAAQLVLLTGSTGPELYRQRLKLTVEAFLEGAGTAPALLKMVAATMGWGPLQGSVADWSANWTPANPVFTARAEGAPGPIRLREFPLRPATTPLPQRVKSGARWTETSSSVFVVQPIVQFKALDQPVVIPTLVNLDARVAIATLVALETVKQVDGEVIEQEVTLRLQGQPDGALRGVLVERALPAGAVIETDIRDRIRIRSGGLRVDRPGEAAFLRNGADDQTASLAISDGRRAIHLTARSEGVWGNAVQVAYVDGVSVELTYDPALAVDDPPSPPDQVHREVLTLDQLLSGASTLVTARDFTFTIPEGESHWLYFDHVGWSVFDATQWDRTVFDDPPAGEGNLDTLFQAYPAKGVYDFTDFNATTFPQEFLRAFRFNQASSRYNEAFFNDAPEQVEVLLGWQEGQRATIRVDVPLESARDHQRLAFLPEMLRKVKAAGVKIILVPRFGEQQALGERFPVVGLRQPETQPLAEFLRLRIGQHEVQSLGDRIIGRFDRDHWNAANFE
jgi:hypothetical protein